MSRVQRLAVRLKSMKNSSWKMIAPEIVPKHAVGIVEACRFFGTSTGKVKKDLLWRNLGKEGSWRTGQFKQLMLKKIMGALCMGERKRASCLLSKLVLGDQNLQSEDFICILEYCARKPDPLFAMETWNTMEEKKIALGDRCCFLTTRALCKGGYVKEAFDIVSMLEENSGVTPTLAVYHNLLQACSRKQSLQYANEFLNLMEHQAVGKNEITYALLLKLAVSQHDLSAVHKIWQECNKNYSLSILILRKFIWSFAMLKDVEAAYMALQHMVAAASQHNFIARSAEGKMQLVRLDIPIPNHDKLAWSSHEKNNFPTHPLPEYYKEADSDKSRDLVKFGAEAKEFSAGGLSLLRKPFSVEEMKLLTWSFNDFLCACASMQNAWLAEQLICQMQNLGLKPSSSTYDGYLRAVVPVQGFRDGVEVLKVMREKNLKPRESTLAAMSVSCSKALELDLAEYFLDQMPKCRYAYPYNALFKACDVVDQPERAVRVLTKMKQLNVIPDIRTYELLFQLFGNVNAPYEDGNMLSQVEAAKRINAIEMDMMKHGIQHSHVSMQHVLKALGMEGMIKELIQYLHVAEDQFSHRNTSLRIPMYETVLHSLVESKETHIAIEIFRSMISCGFPPSAAIYSIMIDCCSIIKCYRSACALISLMIRGGFCLQRVTYTAFIKVILEKIEDFDEALKLIEQARSEGIQPDVLSYNTILRAADFKGRIDMIELVVEQMHQEKIQPDASTCAHVFAAYVNHGFHATALEALQVLSLRMISEQDDIPEETKLKYENLVLDEDSEAESQIVGVMKESATLTTALLQLRWCATSALPISWLPNQSPWAKRLSSDYASRRAGS